MNTGRASNTGWGSGIIVLIEAGSFYSRKYGNLFQDSYYSKVVIQTR